MSNTPDPVNAPDAVPDIPHLTGVHSLLRDIVQDRLPHLNLEVDNLLSLVSMACIDAVAYSAASSVRADDQTITPEAVIRRIAERLTASHPYAQADVPNHTTLLDLCLFTALSIMLNVTHFIDPHV